MSHNLFYHKDSEGWSSCQLTITTTSSWEWSLFMGRINSQITPLKTMRRRVKQREGEGGRRSSSETSWGTDRGRQTHANELSQKDADWRCPTPTGLISDRHQWNMNTSLWHAWNGTTEGSDPGCWYWLNSYDRLIRLSESLSYRRSLFLHLSCQKNNTTKQ